VRSPGQGGSIAHARDPEIELNAVLTERPHAAVGDLLPTCWVLRKSHWTMLPGALTIRARAIDMQRNHT
jgi:hypothetical protein